MSRFEVELELTGLKLKVRGDRQSVPSITQNLGQQVAGLFQPAAQIVKGDTKPVAFLEADVVVPNGNGGKAKSRRTKKAGANHNGAASGDELAVQFRHDPDTWGMPQQSWNTADKSMWLLLVLMKTEVASELSSSQVAQTFNKHFRQSKMIQTSKVSRDLGKRKAANPSLVGQDNSKPDEPWYLTDEGIRYAENLVLSAKGLSGTES